MESDSQEFGPKQWGDILKDNYWLGGRPDLAPALQKFRRAATGLDNAVTIHNNAYDKFDDLHMEGGPEDLSSAADKVLIETQLRALQNIAKYSKKMQETLIPLARVAVTEYVKALTISEKWDEQTQGFAIDSLMTAFGVPEPNTSGPSKPALPRYEAKRAAKKAAASREKTASQEDLTKLENYLQDAPENIFLLKEEGIKPILENLANQELARPFILKAMLEGMHDYLVEQENKSQKRFERVYKRWNINPRDLNKLPPLSQG